MYVIGLTGGIASGKSVVAQRFVEHGAVLVDADVLAREVVEPGTPGLAAISREFGPSVISEDGTLNRPALGAVVFADAAKREKLNAITHPAVWARARQLFADAAVVDPDAIVVYDVPLLVEAADARPLHFDLVVVVSASTETRLDRMVDRRGMTLEDAKNRLAAQASDADRVAAADVIIENDGSLDDTLEQVDRLWERVRPSA